MGRRSQVVRRSSAKALFPSSSLGVASNPSPGVPTVITGPQWYRYDDLRDSDSSVRDALTLGALLAFILIVSVFVTLRIYTQLDQVASVQRTLVESQQELYDVLRSQFDEEIELRGYLATRQPNYLDPYRGDDFGDSLGHLELDVALARHRRARS